MLAYALPAQADVIYACVNSSSGTIKIVAQGDACPNGSSKTSWSNEAPTPPPPTDVYVYADPLSSFPSGTPAVVATLELPAGQYLLHAHIGQATSVEGILRLNCLLQRSGGPPGAISLSKLSVFGAATVFTDMSLAATTTLDSFETISLECTGQIPTTGVASINLEDVKLIAHAVGTINDQSPP